MTHTNHQKDMFGLECVFIIKFRENLVSIDERRQQEALKIFYEKQKKQKQKIHRLKTWSLIINPLICLSFVALFWVFGMNHYYVEV